MSLSKKDLIAFIVFLRKYDVRAIKQYLLKLSFRKYKGYIKIIRRKRKKLVKNKYLNLLFVTNFFKNSTISKFKPTYFFFKKNSQKIFNHKTNILSNNKNFLTNYRISLKVFLKKYAKKLKKLKKLGYFGRKLKKEKKKNIHISKADIYFFILLFTSFISAKLYISKASV